MDNSQLVAPTATSTLLKGPQGLDCFEPLALPAALMAFGTLQRQWEYLARTRAWHTARLAKLNPAYRSPTASKIADLYQ